MTTTETVQGVDLSNWNSDIDWEIVAVNHIGFAFMQATEGNYFVSSSFGAQYEGAFDAGLIRGAYHFAIPDNSSGYEQASYFVDNGGDWSSDGQTLPGVIALLYNPYGEECYNLQSAELLTWINDFDEEYINLTGQIPVIQTTQSWWDTCLGEVTLLNPLWVVDYNNSPPLMAIGWSEYSFWQYSSTGSVSGVPGAVNLDLFNGSESQLSDFAFGD